jgi:cytochrome c-type biogenesis protein CcmH
MDGATVAWGWPVGMLAFGLVIGGLLLFLVRRQAPSPLAADPVELRDLDGQLDVLLGQLRELDDLADPERAARERFALEVRAAEALRAREQGTSATAAPRKAKAAAVAAPVAPTGFFANRPALRGFLWGTGSALAVAVLVFFVWRQAKPREEGGSLTGNLPGEEERRAADPGGADPRVPLQQRIAQNPDDLEARLDLAQLHLRQRDLMGVWNETQYVLEKQPGQPRALAYQALVRLAMGQPQVALDMLKQAVAADPDLLEGYLHLALVHVRMGHTADAEATIKEASARFPTQAPMLAKVLDEMRAVGAEEPAPEGDPHADVAAPAAGEPAPAAALLRGVIELPDALRAKVGSAALVFVTVRAAGVTQGPPVAVKRMPASSFPLEFEIGPADSMMGQPLPERARVEARVDSDGNPLTRDPGDPSARLDDVTAGTRLRLVLQ